MPKSVDASTLMSISHWYIGEKPAKIAQVRFQVRKNAAKSITAILLRSSRQRDNVPERFMTCFSACSVAIEGIIAGQAIEIH